MDTAVEEDTEEERKMPLAIMQGYMTIIQVNNFKSQVCEELCILNWGKNGNKMIYQYLSNHAISKYVPCQEFTEQCGDEEPTHVFLQVYEMKPWTKSPKSVLWSCL